MKTPKPEHVMSDAHRALLDPEVRKVRAMRAQVTEAGERLDTMLGLVFPAWNKGNFVYDPETGGFFKKGTKLPKTNDPTNKPHSRR